MENEKKDTMKGKIQDKLNNWKAELEHLNVQLHLGKDEAKHEFEKQKKNLGKWIDATGDKLHKAKDLTAEKALHLKTSLDELRVQAALGKAETADALKDQQENLSKGIHNLKNNIAKAYHTVEGGINDFVEDANERLDGYHTRIDLFKLHAHLAKMETDESWDDKKKELSGKLHEMSTKLESGKKSASEKWDNFTEEMSEAWSHFRSAF